MTHPGLTCARCGRQLGDPVHNADRDYLRGLPSDVDTSAWHEFVAPEVSEGGD